MKSIYGNPVRRTEAVLNEIYNSTKDNYTDINMYQIVERFHLSKLIPPMLEREGFLIKNIYNEYIWSLGRPPSNEDARMIYDNVKIKNGEYLRVCKEKRRDFKNG